MVELFEWFKHIIIVINRYKDFFDAILDVVTIVVSIITGVSLIIGLSYIKSYRERTTAATFTFWSQIGMRIHEISIILKSNNCLVNNFYPENLRVQYEGVSETEVNIKNFKDKVQLIIDYIEGAPDQMPAYRGWTEDYSKITEFLYDIVIFDICNSKESFKFSNTNNKNRTEYCNEICQVMDTLCMKIKESQISVEEKLYKK